MALTYQWAVPGDREAVEAFLTATYGPDSIQALPGRCRWLFFEHPGGLHVALCRDGERIVACCGHLPARLQLADRLVNAAFGIDFMVHADYRRRGIARTLLGMRLDRFDVSLSSGQSPGMAAVYAGLGDAVSFPFMRALRTRRLASGVPSRALIRDVASVVLGALAARIPGSRRLRPLADAIADGERLTSSTIPGNASTPIVSADELAWRYGRGPYRDYAAQDLLTHDGRRAMLWTRNVGQGERIVAYLGDGRHAAAMLALAAQTSTAVFVELLTTHPATIAAARRAGYLVRKQSGHAVAAAKDPELTRLIRHHGLGLMAGDSDTDLMRRPVAGAHDQGA